MQCRSRLTSCSCMSSSALKKSFSSHSATGLARGLALPHSDSSPASFAAASWRAVGLAAVRHAVAGGGVVWSASVRCEAAAKNMPRNSLDTSTSCRYCGRRAESSFLLHDFTKQLTRSHAA